MMLLRFHLSGPGYSLIMLRCWRLSVIRVTVTLKGLNQGNWNSFSLFLKTFHLPSKRLCPPRSLVLCFGRQKPSGWKVKRLSSFKPLSHLLHSILNFKLVIVNFFSKNSTTCLWYCGRAYLPAPDIIQKLKITFFSCQNPAFWILLRTTFIICKFPAEMTSVYFQTYSNVDV